VDEEVAVAARAHRVASVSPLEARAFERAGVRDVQVLSHGVDLRPTTRPFQDRRNLLFVGRLSEEGSPNVDALLWFLDHAFPLVREQLSADGPVELLVAGQMSSVSLAGRTWPGVHFLGAVDDLRPLYDEARLFFAPHRFSAGVPLKILEAAAYGLPTVTTDLLSEQLGWTDREVLSGSVGDAEAFARNCRSVYADERLWTAVRRGALVRIGREASMERFMQALERALGP
jgi:glycosyltransferase involved in cell wall biosynthesis